MTVCIADPPWSYQNWTDKKAGAAAASYETIGTPDICALAPAVDQVVGPDAILALWGTWPKLPDALHVMAAWGFDYVTACPWVKYTPGRDIYTGIGFWFQSCSEVLLIGRRGNVPGSRIPLLGLLSGEDRQFYAPATRKHSRKPYGVHEWLEDKFPGEPKVELFATEVRPGWTCVGRALGLDMTPNGIVCVEPTPNK